MIRRARESEAESLSDLAIRSKAHWEYTPEQLAVFRGELTITADDIATKRAHVSEVSASILGFYTLVSLDDPCMELEHIFVNPNELSRGIGSQLFHHACANARETGATTLVIQSDPNAAGFYHALGATLEKQIPSSIPGRTIPFFTYALTARQASDT